MKWTGKLKCLGNISVLYAGKMFWSNDIRKKEVLMDRPLPDHKQFSKVSILNRIVMTQTNTNNENNVCFLASMELTTPTGLTEKNVFENL
ncbi:hypothetical protein BLOT_015909 [Blomia tropicalis]|nr:hypothetical protein BLOT_015909 [Blomia tropicalis]